MSTDILSIKRNIYKDKNKQLNTMHTSCQLVLLISKTTKSVLAFILEPKIHLLPQVLKQTFTSVLWVFALSNQRPMQGFLVAVLIQKYLSILLLFRVLLITSNPGRLESVTLRVDSHVLQFGDFALVVFYLFVAKQT